MTANYFTELESAYSSLNIEDDIHEDFFSEFDLDEINQPELFSCSICAKILKTKKGLERHEERHRLKSSIKLFDVECWHRLIKSAVEKLIEEDLQDNEVLSELKSFSVDCKDDHSCLQPFVDTIMYVHDLEKFYPMFYKVVTQTSSLHGLSKEGTIIVGFELAHHVIGHYKKELETVNPSRHTATVELLNERDIAVVTYISGYIFSNFYRKLRRSSEWETVLYQQKLQLLKAGRVEGAAVDESDQRYNLVRCRDRGGLWYVRNDVIVIFSETEKEFQRRTQGFFTKIPFDEITKAVVSLDIVQSSLKDLQSLSSCEIPFEEEVLNNFLYHIVMLYVRVRAHLFLQL